MIRPLGALPFLVGFTSDKRRSRKHRFTSDNRPESLPISDLPVPGSRTHDDTSGGVLAAATLPVMPEHDPPRTERLALYMRERAEQQAAHDEAVAVVERWNAAIAAGCGAML